MTKPSAVISTVHNFIEEIGKLPKAPKGGMVTFRGQRDANWKQIAGLFRPNSQSLKEYEQDLVRKLFSTHPQEFSGDTTMFDRLVRMQHYGLPTRLMDVTGNPLAALYFAAELAPKGETETNGSVFINYVPAKHMKYYDSDAVSCIAHLSNLSKDEKQNIADAILAGEDINKLDEVERLCQFVRGEKSYFKTRLDPDDLRTLYYVIPKMTNRRLVSQNGAFILYGLRGLQRPSVSRIKSLHIIIKSDDKAVILDQLDRLNINNSTIYPEIENTARYLRDLYLRGEKIV